MANAGPDGTPRYEVLVDDDAVSHRIWLVNENGNLRPGRDILGWYETACGLKHPGPIVLHNAITCIACLAEDT